MSLYKKLVTLVGFLIIVILSLTLTIVYETTQSMMIKQARHKAISVIQTIDSALESGIPDFEFESILIHLKRQDPEIRSFDIYKLTGYLYDIASTDPAMIGTQASKAGSVAVEKNTVVSNLRGDTLQVIAPIHVNGQPVYAASVAFSLAKDIAETRRLLVDVLIIGVVALLIALVAIWVFVRRLLSKPLLTVVEAANDIAVGRLAIDVAPFALRSDEIGLLARSFDAMARNLHTLISGISTTSEQIAGAFQTLVTSGDRTAHGALHVSDVMSHVSHAMDRQNRMATEAADAVENVAESLDVTLRGSEESAREARGIRENVRQTAPHAEQIVASLQGLRQASLDSLSLHKELLHNIVGMEEFLQKLTTALKQWQETANSWQAHGTAADSKTEEQSKQAVFLATDQLVTLFADIGSALAPLNGSIGQITQHRVSLATAVHGVGGSVHDAEASLSGGFAQLRASEDDALAVSDRIREISLQSNTVVQTMERMAEMARETNEDLRNISATADGQSASIRDVNVSAARLSEMAAELRRLVSWFDLPDQS